MGVVRQGHPPAQHRGILHSVSADGGLRLRRLLALPGGHHAPPQAGRLDSQSGAVSGLLAAALRLRDGGGPGDPRARAELDLAGTDRCVRRRAGGRPPRVLREGRPLEPEAGGGGRGRRSADRLAARGAAGDRHQHRGRRSLDVRAALALRPMRLVSLAADDRASRGSPPRTGSMSRSTCSARCCWSPSCARRSGPAEHRPDHRGRRGAAARPAGAARRPRLAGLLRAAPREERASGPPAARRRSPTAWWAGCRWPPAIRSATPRPGPARSSRGWPRRASTAGSPR